MAIHVICTGCKSRFSVSDQYAGKKGPCPKCGVEITIPRKEEAVVIHEPESVTTQVKDAKGRPVFKPVKWQGLQVSPVLWWVVGGGVVALFAAAFAMRTAFALSPGEAFGENAKFPLASFLVLATAAALLGPPMSWLGYLLLHDRDGEVFEGGEFYLRSAICGLVHALLWGAYSYAYFQVFTSPAEPPANIWFATFAAIPMIGCGAFASYAAFDLEPPRAFFHYFTYLALTVLLLLAMGRPPF